MEYQNPQTDIARPELIAKLKGYISDAQKVPISELCKAGDYENQPGLRYPQTKGEYLVDEMLSLLLSQSWIDPESEPVLDEMTSILGQLDMGVDKPEEWQELFQLAEEINRNN